MKRHNYSGLNRKLKVEERVCTICNSGEIEDEMHFVMKCKAYDVPGAYAESN